MWGTYLLDIYAQRDARQMRDAIEELLGPTSGSSWATGGVYVFWNPQSREPLYVGIAGDLAVRFGQHNNLRSCPAGGCKREQIKEYFASECDELGYTIIPLSSLSQPDTARVRSQRSPELRSLYAADTYFADEAIDEIRALEGRLIAWHNVRFGQLPRWNRSPGRLPERAPDSDDGAMQTAVGGLDILLQARKPIRELAAAPQWASFEEYLHGVRIVAVAQGVLTGRGVRNDMVRRLLDRFPANQAMRDAIRAEGYVNRRNPLTVGPTCDS